MDSIELGPPENPGTHHSWVDWCAPLSFETRDPGVKSQGPRPLSHSFTNDLHLYIDHLYLPMHLQLLNYIYIILLILIVFQEMITGLTEDIARKREEIKHQQAQIKQLTKERDEAVTKIMSIQEEFKRNKPHRLKKTS